MSEFCQGKINGEPPYYVRRPCSRKAVRDGFCGIHHPDAEAARREKGRARSNAAYAELMRQNERKFKRPAEYLEALRQIATGNLDAEDCHSIARAVLDKWGERAAQGIEAQRAETTGSVGEADSGPAPKADAQGDHHE